MCWFKKKKKAVEAAEDKENKKNSEKAVTLDSKVPFIIARSKTKLKCGVDMVNNYTAITEPDDEGYYLVVRTGEINFTWGKKWGNIRAHGYVTVSRKRQNDQIYNDIIANQWRTSYKDGVEIGYLYESIYDTKLEKYIGFAEELREKVVENKLGQIKEEDLRDKAELEKHIESLLQQPEFRNELAKYGVENIKMSVKNFVQD